MLIKINYLAKTWCNLLRSNRFKCLFFSIPVRRRSPSIVTTKIELTTTSWYMGGELQENVHTGPARNDNWCIQIGELAVIDYDRCAQSCGSQSRCQRRLNSMLKRIPMSAKMIGADWQAGQVNQWSALRLPLRGGTGGTGNWRGYRHRLATNLRLARQVH